MQFLYETIIKALLQRAEPALKEQVALLPPTITVKKVLVITILGMKWDVNVVLSQAQ